jgi:hypothetical protein
MDFENGVYKGIPIIKTRHPNISKGVIIGKKSWGLWKNEWTDGIVEGSFTPKEILQQFTDNNIKVPESLMIDFNNTIIRKFNKLLK